MGKIFLVRHGETDWHLEHRILGRTDKSLNERGFEQGRLIAQHFAGQELAALYVSPIQRCRETIAALAARTGLEPVVVEGMMEVDFGEWDGRKSTDIMAESPELLKSWLMNPSSISIPGGENMAEVRERVVEAMNWILPRHNLEQNILVLSHGGPIRMVVCQILGMDIDRMLRLEVDLASVTTLKFFGDSLDSRIGLSKLNDTSHLDLPECDAGDVLEEMRVHEESER
jgi:broad specificity phosphatase PhoE